jgi:hypothetical protein
MVRTSVKNQLRKYYYNPKHPGSYSSATKFYSSVRNKIKGISKSDVINWLSSQDAYTAHKSLKRKFRRPKVIAPYKKYMFDIDTAYMEKYPQYNDGYKYFLLLTDILSHYVWVKPLKSLKATEVKSNLIELLKKNKPEILRSDRGSEFINNLVTNYLKEQNIKHIKTTGETKANYAERAIKTIKMKLQRYFTNKQSRKWIDVLQDVVQSYNDTLHKTILMSPSDALSTNDSILWDRQYGQSNINTLKKHPKINLSVGDTVKISKLKKSFEREYDEKWTNEYFIITDINTNQGVPVVSLKDYNNDPIEGIFYIPELQKIKVDADTVYKIDKVISSRTVAGKKEYLVKWLGWDDKFNTYISEAELKEYKPENHD